jgi:Tol biopolymer transport system component
VAWTLGQSPERDVWTSRYDGTDAKRLTMTAGDDYGGDWSPRGDRIAFSSFREGNFDILTIAPDGSRTTNLTKSLDAIHGVGHDTDGIWSPDGSKIAFIRNTDSLWTMASDGTAATQVLVLPYISSLRWSPDGRSILLSSTGMNKYHRDLYLLSLSEGQALQLTNTPGVHEDSGRFSPDGASLALTRQLARDADVWLMAPDGSRAGNLPPDRKGRNEFSGPWTLDGGSLVISSDTEVSNKLFIVPATGGPYVRITDNDFNSGGEWPVALSPDGRRVLFTRYMDEYRIAVAGSVTLDGSEVYTWPVNDSYAVAVSWSPGSCDASR